MSSEKTGRVSVSWVVYLLAVLGIVIGVVATYLAWETKKQSDQQIQAAGEKIQSTEKDLGELRSTHEQSRTALEKKIQEDTGKLRIQLEFTAGQVQKLEEEGKVFSRELEVISTLKTQQQSIETRLDTVDKSSRETSRKLEFTQAGLEDLKKFALKASISPQDPSARNAPVGMKLYLTRESLATIAQTKGISLDPIQLKEKWKNLFLYPSGNPEGQKIENAVSRSAVATGVVGSDGAVELQQVPPGEYYVLGATGQAGGFVYEKKIKVDQNTQDIFLNR
jgi:flagellar basal body-associated protein FliL